MNAFSFPILLAQMAEPTSPRQMSYLGWMFNALGPFYGLVIPLTGFVIFIGACLVVALSRRPAVIASYLVFLPLPLMIGVYGSLHGFISAFSVVSISATTPKPSIVAEGISTGLFTSLVGLFVTFPAYFVIAIGLFLTTLFSAKKE